MDLCKSDQNKFWATVGDILGRNSNQKIGRVIEYGTDNLCNEEDSVNTINQFFAEIGENILKGQPCTEHKQLDSRCENEKNTFL